MAQLITVRLSKSDQQPLGFRLQGGKDFGTPLVVQKVNGGSSAERAGLQAGDALIRVNATDVYTLRHQEAQDAIRAAGTNLELTVQRGGGTWRPQVTPTGSLPRPGSRPLGAAPTPVTSTSLRATPQPNQAFGSGHNNVPKPYGYTNGNEAAAVKSIVNKQYNTPVNMYSEQTIAETLSAQSEVLAGGVLGVNFKKNEKTYDAEKSAVFKVLQEEQNDPEPEPSHFYTRASVARAGTPCCLHRARSGTPRVLNTPVPAASVRPRSSTGTQTPAPEPEPEPAQLAPEPPHRPSIPVGCHQVLPDGRLVLGAPAQPPVPPPAAAPLPVVADTPHCADCNRYIIGVFVRIKDKNLHVECFKCATCGAALKNQGYYNINQKLYCDIHAALAARQQPPAPHLEPVVVPPGGRIPSNAYSTPLPPLSTNNYTNGSSSMFSPSSNLSGPKPFGSSFGSAYSPSLSPRSAPLSPARHVAAPAPAPVPPPVAPAHAPPAPFTASHAPAAPYAPTKNVKSVVWPPPNSPEDEPPKVSRDQEPIPTKPGIAQGLVTFATPKGMISSCDSRIQNASAQHSQQISEVFSSKESFASASVSAAASMTTSESVVQEAKSQEINESTTVVESFSEQKSKNQSVTIYQSETSPPIQKCFDNPMESNLDQQNGQFNFECTSSKRKESVTSIKSEKFEQSVKENIEKKDEKYFEKENHDNLASKNIECNESFERKQSITSAEKSNQQQIQDSSDAGDALKTKQSETVFEENKTSFTEFVEEKKIIQTSQESSTNSQPRYSISNSEPLSVCKQSDNRRQSTQNSETQSICNRDDKPRESIPDLEIPANKSPPSNIQNSIPRGFISMVDALTTAPDRPYSPLPIPTQPLIPPIPPMEEPTPAPVSSPRRMTESQISHPPLQLSNMFTQQPKQGFSPIPPITPYNPPESTEAPVPMPPETTPYIPPDFKIIIEPKAKPREAAASPMIEALTTAPDRPFTPAKDLTHDIETGSLIQALTVAPERSFSPLPLNIINQNQVHQVSSSILTSDSTVQVQSSSSQILRPIATQTTTNMSEHIQQEFSSMQNTCQLQSSSEVSAFRPVSKQTFPPPSPEEFCKLMNYHPPDMKSSFEQSSRIKQESMVTQSKTMQSTTTMSSSNTQTFSSVKSAQSYFEQLDKRENLCSTSVRSKSGLHKPDTIPTYQKNFDQLLSQRGITPEICSAPAVLQRPVTPTTEPPTRPMDKSLEPNAATQPTKTFVSTTQIQTPVQQPVYFHKDTTPISMTFQPVSDEALFRASPARSRPSTPSKINKPAPIIPHYQMNLVTVEHNAAASSLYDPSSPETSRSPTPKLRSKSPASGPPANPLKAQAPRIKDTQEATAPLRPTGHNLLTQATTNLRKEHESAQKDLHSNVETFNTSGANKWSNNQPSVIKEQRSSNVGFKSEHYEQSGKKIKEDSLFNQNSGHKQMQTQNIAEYGNTVVQSTIKCFEEFESTQSAKVIEIRSGGSSSFGTQQIDSNLRPSSINPRQVFPPPLMSDSSSQQISSVNFTNKKMPKSSSEADHAYPPNSGANQTPVCDPTPSTGSSVGAGGASRGKTFGVSSAPKRGRGVLNKAAMPGSRVPLCASCNGNIRGPFITALGRIWCPEHFVCVSASCRRALQDIGFVEEGGQLYCEYCFEQYIAPACDKCHAKIKGDCLNAIGKHFHPECFNCVYCGKLFGNNPFFLEDGLPYCESDWNELFTTKCFACGFPVEAGDRWVEALNNNYHSQCFNCTVCKKNLEGQSFFAKGGRPFCKLHAR